MSKSAEMERPNNRTLGIAATLLLLLAAATAAPLFGTTDGAVAVTVHCEALKGKANARVRVLQASVLGVVQIASKSESSFDQSGTCRLELVPGEYIFETTFVDGTTITALRTPVRRISRESVVELEAAEPVPLTFKSNEDAPVVVEELAVRSAATTGEVDWSADQKGTPRLILSPGLPYRVRAIGHAGNLRFAIWQDISTTKPVLLLQGDQVCRCKFNIRKDGPSIRDATVRFKFPDSEMRFPVTDETVFVTNRRFVSFGYGINLENGRHVTLRPWLGIVKEQQEFQLGGPFKPAAWFKVLLRKPVGGPETRHLMWGANLYDAHGHMVLTDQSQIDWHDSIRTRSGMKVPVGRALEKEDLATFKGMQDSLLVDVSYNLDKYVSGTLQPMPFTKFGDRRFHTLAPPTWGLQAVNYLERAERVFHMIEDLENKPSKHRVEVRWLAMEGTAWGCAPAGGNAHIMMPFSGLKGSFNYYDSPWALAHEMLHTFGYGHGDKMNRMNALVSKRFEQYRWFMADHPEQDPEVAFRGFRVATRADRVLHPVIPETPAKEMAKSKGKGKKKKK